MSDINIRKSGNTRLFEWLICIFYIWYFLPAANAIFSAGFYKYIFFGCFFAGLVGLFLFGKLRINMVIGAVLSYFIIFTVMYLLGVGHASRHIRVSFTFWGTAILYFGLLEEDAKIRIGKFLLVLYVVTCMTSAIGVVLNNSAARTIAYARADETVQASYKKMNIGNIFIFQSMISFIPLLICLPKTIKAKFFADIVLVIIFFVLANASFLISVIGFIFAVVFSLVIKQKNVGRMIAIVIVAVLLLVLYLIGYDLLTLLCDTIDNTKFVERLYGIRELIYSGQKVGDAGLRWKLYAVSIETFIQNPFGVGINYSYKIYDMGIGHHSQVLDDLARYGVAAIAFYAMFFSGYYKNLKESWRRAGNERIAVAICVIYFAFLVLNIGFCSGEESVAMLFVMPTVPILIANKNKKNEIRALED